MASDDAPLPLPIRVLIVDDHPVVRAGLAAVIACEPDLDLVGQGENGERGVALYRELRPDVVLMDLRMPVLDGIGATRAILAEFPEARVLALSTFEGDGDIRRALEAGARGYLLKDMLVRDVISAIRAVRADDRVIPDPVAERLAEYPAAAGLTAREREILTLVARGLSNREIARELNRAEETVKDHLKSVFAKLGAADRTAAVSTAVVRGLIRLD